MATSASVTYLTTSSTDQLVGSPDGVLVGGLTSLLGSLTSDTLVVELAASVRILLGSFGSTLSDAAESVE